MRLADRVEFTVPGQAVPKGSRIAGRRKDGGIYTRPANKGEKEWCLTVAKAGMAAGIRVPPPYAVRIWFGMRRPAKPAYPWPSKSDVDKLERGFLDGLVAGGVLVDDRHVIDIHSSKFYADIPGTRVLVQSLRTTHAEMLWPQEEGLAPSLLPPSAERLGQ